MAAEKTTDGPRVAWLGPTPGEGSGATYAGTQMLLALADLGVSIDCYLAVPRADVASAVRAHPNITVLAAPVGWWAWDRWYSQHPLAALLSGLVARAQGQWRLVGHIVDRHRSSPYDVVYQFGQLELIGLRAHCRRLPPIVLHPGTHAAGELRWFWRERALARRAGTSPARFALVGAMLFVRSRVQRSDIRLAAVTVAMSRAFAGHLTRDYRVPATRLAVVSHVVDLARFRPHDREERTPGPVRIVFASAMSVRKGVDLVVALSQRLADLEGTLLIEAIGSGRQWSDYEPLLNELDPRMARATSSITPEEMAETFREADLVVQPSLYEPFALTVGEALASGTPVVASDEVGATEGVDNSCCRVFPAGDLAAFEREVRAMVAIVSGPRRAEVRAIARTEAMRLFAPAPVATRLREALRWAAMGRAPELS